jgi:hypothetical protein
MTNDEAERVIRYLIHEWAKLRGVKPAQAEQPSFSDFYSWLQQEHPAYPEFRSSTSVRDDVERWFDGELKQNWRN